MQSRTVVAKNSLVEKEQKNRGTFIESEVVVCVKVFHVNISACVLIRKFRNISRCNLHMLEYALEYSLNKLTSCNV